MKAYPAAFAIELANDAHPSIARCVVIGATTPIYRTLWNVAVTFAGITYEPDEFDFGEVQAVLVPASPSLTFRIQNLRHPVTGATRPWSAVLAAEDLNGKLLTVRFVSTALLADATAQESVEWVIRKASIRGNFCELELGPPYDIARLRLPWPPVRSHRCTHEYKDGLCKSESSLTTCPTKDVAACAGRHPAAKLRMSQLPYDTDMRGRGG